MIYEKNMKPNSWALYDSYSNPPDWVHESRINGSVVFMMDKHDFLYQGLNRFYRPTKYAINWQYSSFPTGKSNPLRKLLDSNLMRIHQSGTNYYCLY